MSTSRSLSFQASCLRDLLPAARSDEIREGLESALKTLEWIERREDLFRMLEALRKDDPHLYDLFIGFTRTFPKISLADIRAVEAEAERAGL